MSRPTPADVIVQPTSVVELDLPHAEDVEVVITSRSTHALVEYRQPTLNAWGVAYHYYPELTGGSAAALIVLLLLALRRWGLRKPPVRLGESYCRKCGYGLDYRVSPNCPECGVELTDRMVRVARKRASLVPWTLLVLSLLAGTGWGGLMLWGPSRDDRLQFKYDWPSATLAQLVGPRLGRWSYYHRGYTTRLETVHVETGQRFRVLDRADLHDQSWPDPLHQRFEAVVSSFDHLDVYDLATGEHRGRINRPDPGDASGGVFVTRTHDEIRTTSSHRLYRWRGEDLLPYPATPLPRELHRGWWWYYDSPLDRGVTAVSDEETIYRVDVTGRVATTIGLPETLESFSPQWATTHDGHSIFVHGQPKARSPDLIYEYDPLDGHLRRTFLIPGRIAHVSLSTDDRYLLAATDYRAVHVLSVATGERLADLAPPPGLSWKILNADFTPDGKRILVYGFNRAYQRHALVTYDINDLPDAPDASLKTDS